MSLVLAYMSFTGKARRTDQAADRLGLGAGKFGGVRP
jgi:hypothetical protein